MVLTDKQHVLFQSEGFQGNKIWSSSLRVCVDKQLSAEKIWNDIPLTVDSK